MLAIAVNETFKKVLWSQVRPVLVALAARVNRATFDNPARFAMRIIAAYELEENQQATERRVVADDPRQRPFSQCAHCAVTFFQARWKRWKKLWFIGIRFHHWQTYAPWSNQIPPREPDSELGIAYGLCCVAGMRSNEHGQFIPGLQTQAEEYFIRAEDTQEDDELCNMLLTGVSMEFSEFSQPPILGWNRERARREWLANDESVKKAIADEWTTWRGAGPKGNGFDKWEGPLNFPQVTITTQYNLRKNEYEQTSEARAGPPGPNQPQSAVFSTLIKDRIITNTAPPPGGAGQNEASEAETTCVYASASSFAANAKPGGTASRVDEPRCYTVQGTEWSEHGVITVIEPGSLDSEDDEVYMQHTAWVFGEKHLPRWQMRKGFLIQRMRQRGFGGTRYPELLSIPDGAKWPSKRAVPQDETGDWTDIIMDDYGSCWVSSGVSKLQCHELHELLTILGPSSKLSKLVQVCFRDVREARLDFAFGGVGFWLAHPMQEPAFAYVTQVKVVKYVLLAVQVLKIIDESSGGVRGNGKVHHKLWQQLVGSLNYAYVYTSLSWFFIELIQDLWAGYTQEWKQRGDPCMGKTRKGKARVVDWMPSVGSGFRFPSSYMVQPSVTSIEHLERCVRELAERNGKKIYTGLPYQGFWRGQIQESNEELVALRGQGECFLTTGPGFLFTDATRKVAASLTGKECAVMELDNLQIMQAEMRASMLGMVHSEHELLPPTARRAQIRTRTWHPEGEVNPLPDDVDEFGVSLGNAPRYAQPLRKDVAYLAAAR